jgi:monovalent cation:H+ antiporter-2, CPA2 family
VAVSLAQVGEFSFILAEMGADLGILPEEGRDLILAGALISIILNPLAFWAAERLLPRVEQRGLPAPAAGAGLQGPDGAAAEEAPDGAAPAAAQPALSALREHIVLVGYGRVGIAIAESLNGDGTTLVVIEVATDRVALARKLGLRVVEANAATTGALLEARIDVAATLFVAIPNAFEAGQAVEVARRLNPKLRIIARAHSDQEADYLRQLGADRVVMGEREIGMGMVEQSRL